MTQTPAGLHGFAAVLGQQNGPLCGDFAIRIGRDGTWYYQGSPIGRIALVKLFASVLRRVGDEYWLVTPYEQGRIVVDDAPFVAVAVDATGTGRDRVLTFRTNLDETVTADAEHPIRVEMSPDSGEPRPYIDLRPGLAALIARPVYYELAELAEPGPDDGTAEYGVWSKGTFFRLV